MPFTQETFTPVSSHGNTDSPKLWSYRTEDDKATVLADSYLDDKFYQLNNGDMIYFDTFDAKFIGEVIKTSVISVADINAGGSFPADAIRGGWANYINGDLTPINVPAGVETKLTLDANSGTIVDQYLPTGVTSLWNSTTNQFDFSDLSVGDMVDIRVDGSLTNTGFNESFVLNLVAAIGTANEFTLPFASGNRIFAGTSIVSRYNGIYLGSQNIVDAPAELRVVTTDDASGFLVDIYIKVLKIGL